MARVSELVLEEYCMVYADSWKEAASMSTNNLADMGVIKSQPQVNPNGTGTGGTTSNGNGGGGAGTGSGGGTTRRTKIIPRGCARRSSWCPGQRSLHMCRPCWDALFRGWQVPSWLIRRVFDACPRWAYKLDIEVKDIYHANSLAWEVLGLQAIIWPRPVDLRTGHPISYSLGILMPRQQRVGRGPIPQVDIEAFDKSVHALFRTRLNNIIADHTTPAGELELRRNLPGLRLYPVIRQATREDGGVRPYWIDQDWIFGDGIKEYWSAFPIGMKRPITYVD